MNCQDEKWKEEWSVIFDGQEIEDIAITEDGKMIVIGTERGEVHVFDKNGNLLWVGQTDPSEEICQIGIPQDHSFYAIAARDMHLYVFDEKGKIILKMGTTDHCYHVKVSQDGSIIATLDGRGVLCIQNKIGDIISAYFTSGEILMRNEFGVGTYGLSMSRNGKTIAAIASYEEIIQIHVIDDKGHLLWKKIIGDENKEIPLNVHLVVSGDGNTIIVGEHHDWIMVYDRMGKIKWKHSIASFANKFKLDPTIPCAISFDGSVTAFAFDDVLKIYNQNGIELWSYTFDEPIYDILVRSLNQDKIIAIGPNTVYLLDGKGKLIFKKRVIGIVNRFIATNDCLYFVLVIAEGENRFRVVFLNCPEHAGETSFPPPAQGQA